MVAKGVGGDPTTVDKGVGGDPTTGANAERESAAEPAETGVMTPAMLAVMRMYAKNSPLAAAMLGGCHACVLDGPTSTRRTCSHDPSPQLLGTAQASRPHLDLSRAPYVLYGVKYSNLVSR